MAEATLKIEVAAPNFFAIPTKKLVIENEPGTGRTYFIHNGAIVAVARRTTENRATSTT